MFICYKYCDINVNLVLLKIIITIFAHIFLRQLKFHMNQLSKRLQSLSPSETLAMAQKSSELQAQGFDIINMSVGEPDFPTPSHIKDAAKKAIDGNVTFYSFLALSI